MSKKTPPKTPKKLPKIPGMPKDASIKVIEITPKTFLIPVLVITLLWAIYSTWANQTGEKITYNDDA